MRLTPSQQLKKIEKKLSLCFKKPQYLLKALTHSSAVGSERSKSNEVLEFLGDAVLELIVRKYLIEKFPEMNEGELNVLKKRYTCEEVLYKIGKDIGIGECLIMDKGEELTGGRTRQSNISGAFEALLGAIYLDRGFDYVNKYVRKHFLIKKVRLSRDHKSLLNQWAMKNRKVIDYLVIREEGPPHKRTFYVALCVNGKKVAEGQGISKKEAEQESARKFLKQK